MHTCLRRIFFVNNSEGTDSIFVMITCNGHPMFTGITFYQSFVSSNQALFKASVYPSFRCIAWSFDVLSLIKYIYADLMNWISIYEKCSCWNLWAWIFSSNILHVKFIFIEFILTQLFRWHHEYFMMIWHMHLYHIHGIHANVSYQMRADCNKNHSKWTFTIFAPNSY